MPIDHLPRFAGMKIVESPMMTEDGEPYEVRRPWRERLFTRPWRPFKTTRTVVSPDVFWTPDGTLVIYPKMHKAFRWEIKPVKHTCDTEDPGELE